MTDDPTPPDNRSIDPADAPDPIIVKGRSISLVWVIPVVALVVGAIIAVDAIRSRGVKAIVELPDAEWVEAGKTKVKYLSIEIGTVDEVEPRTDLKGVQLHITLSPTAGQHLTEDARFWLVHPRIGAGGISGLGTLLSGAYLAMAPGTPGKPLKKTFKGLLTPPLESNSEPGLSIKLHTEELHSLDIGAPVFYREFEVGKVEGRKLEADGSGVVLSLFFPAEHADLVRKDSRFWNAGGFHVSGSLANLEVETESLASIIAGGIAFDAPTGNKSKPAEDDASFWLHRSRSDIETYPFRYGGLRIYVEAPQLGSVSIGDLVYYREIPVGSVIRQELLNDSRHVRIGLNIQKRYAPLVRSNSVFWNASGITADLGLGGLEIHAESLQSILAGGIAFATPDAPGHLVEPGSVFELHPEVKDKWLEWSPLIWRGDPAHAPAGAVASSEGTDEEKHPIRDFFHHGKKNADDSAKASEANKDPRQESAHEEKRHGFFHRLFHGEESESGSGD